VEIFPGVYQLKFNIPNSSLGHIACYLLSGKQGWILIDTAWDTEEAFDSLMEQLRQAGIDLRDIAYILMTHTHPDHFGLAGRIKRLTSAKIAYHYLEKAMVESRYVHLDEFQKTMGELLHSHGVPAISLPKLQAAFKDILQYASATWPDQMLYGGERFSNGSFELQAICTPGHSPGHLCFYEPAKKLLFTGDHILPVTTPHVNFDTHYGINPLGDYIYSVKQLEKLPVQLVLPAHEHIFKGLGERVREILSHHEERMKTLQEIISKEAKSAWTVSTKFYWHIPGMTWDQMPPIFHYLAITEMLAHLELLSIEGKAERITQNGFVLYRQASGS
jgi:glyoxylase-like metal-dependent hydrolase (beta-lactamase superfamily II)